MENKKLHNQKVAYNLIFNIENTLRVGIHNLLIDKYGVNYKVSNVFPKFKYKLYDKEKQYDFGNHVKIRKQNEIDYNLIVGYEYPDLWYLDFTHIAIIIDYFWDSLFRELFNGGNNTNRILNQRMKILFPIRNSVAHNRYVSDTDLSDLNNYYSILSKLIKKKYLYNYENLVFTKPEEYREIIIEGLDYIKGCIDNKKVINEGIFNEMKSSMSAIIQLVSINNDIIYKQDKLLTILKEYNELPRVPGGGENIGIFINNHDILSMIENIINSLR